MTSHLTCPITLQLMNDPVIASDGHTYERSAITRWIQEHGKSPQTNQPMRVKDLVPNRAIRSLIEGHRRGNPDADAAGAAATVTTTTTKNDNTLPADLRNNLDQNQPLVCSEELYRTISATTKASIHPNSHNSKQSIVHIQTPTLEDTTASSHICCVIDVSGSMAAEASCKDEQGLENRTGLSILDVVKFSTLVISKSLRGRDRLSIVTYSTNATVVLEPTAMDDDGKEQVEKVLSTIHPQNMTNLWDGMKAGITLANRLGDDFNNSIFVLTDGIPNVHPPLGYERSLKRLFDGLPLNGAVSTFGFGYNLDSPLLAQIARDGGGYFSFIPDAGFVGTCFINAVANARCAFGMNPFLRVKALDGIKDSPLNSLYRIEEEEEKPGYVRIQITSLRYGAPLDIIIDHAYVSASSEMELGFKTVGGKEITIPVQKHRRGDKILDLFHTSRIDFIQKGLEAAKSPFTPSKRNIFVLSDEATSFRNNDKNIDALCQDIEGQATEAISCSDYYDRWGRPYLFSLLGAHTHQFCNNFKDPGVQLYGTGKLFSSLQEGLNDIFETIPAPKPSGPRAHYWKGRAGGSKGTTNMSRAFNNRNAVCFHGNTRIIVQKTKSLETFVSDISKIKKGDFVLTELGKFAKVECVVETVTQTPLDIVVLNNLRITPYHPIKLSASGDWMFPINCAQMSLERSDSNSVYNLVLEDNHRSDAIMTEDGIACITLGHGITSNDTLRHDYFGTNLVIQDLRNAEFEWMRGHIILHEEDIKRKHANGDIFKITFSKSPQMFCKV